MAACSNFIIRAQKKGKTSLYSQLSFGGPKREEGELFALARSLCLESKTRKKRGKGSRIRNVAYCIGAKKLGGGGGRGECLYPFFS